MRRSGGLSYLGDRIIKTLETLLWFVEIKAMISLIGSDS